MSKQATPDTAAYPSPAWLLIPILLVPLGLFIRTRLAARKLARTGIGRGAPGFQTSVRRIAVTPEIARRLRAGEEVSPEEIAAAQAQVAAEAAGGAGSVGAGGEGGKRGRRAAEDATNKENEWLPEELRRGSRGATRARRGTTRR